MRSMRWVAESMTKMTCRGEAKWAREAEKRKTRRRRTAVVEAAATTAAATRRRWGRRWGHTRQRPVADASSERILAYWAIGTRERPWTDVATARKVTVQQNRTVLATRHRLACAQTQDVLGLVDHVSYRATGGTSGRRSPTTDSPTDLPSVHPPHRNPRVASPVHPPRPSPI